MTTLQWTAIVAGIILVAYCGTGGGLFDSFGDSSESSDSSSGDSGGGGGGDGGGGD